MKDLYISLGMLAYGTSCGSLTVWLTKIIQNYSEMRIFSSIFRSCLQNFTGLTLLTLPVNIIVRARSKLLLKRYGKLYMHDSIHNTASAPMMIKRHTKRNSSIGTNHVDLSLSSFSLVWPHTFAPTLDAIEHGDRLADIMILPGNPALPCPFNISYHSLHSYEEALNERADRTVLSTTRPYKRGRTTPWACLLGRHLLRLSSADQNHLYTLRLSTIRLQDMSTDLLYTI